MSLIVSEVTTVVGSVWWTVKQKGCFDSFGYLSFLPLCIIEYSGIPLPALHSNSD